MICRLLVSKAEMDVSVASGGRLLVDQLASDRAHLLGGAARDAFLVKHPDVADALAAINAGDRAWAGRQRPDTNSEFERLRSKIEHLVGEQVIRDAVRDSVLHLQEDLHAAELVVHAEVHADQVAELRDALVATDLLGQAKGILMVTLGCSAALATDALSKRAALERRSVVEIAADITAHVAGHA